MAWLLLSCPKVRIPSDSPSLTVFFLLYRLLYTCFFARTNREICFTPLSPLPLPFPSISSRLLKGCPAPICFTRIASACVPPPFPPRNSPIYVNPQNMELHIVSRLPFPAKRHRFSFRRTPLVLVRSIRRSVPPNSLSDYVELHSPFPLCFPHSPMPTPTLPPSSGFVCPSPPYVHCQ